MSRIAIACQGGGSHTAFTAGVLRHVLANWDDEDELVGLSGTSGGALNAVGAWYGLATDGRERAIEILDAIWNDVTADDFFDRVVNHSSVWTRRIESGGFAFHRMSPYVKPTTAAVEREFRDLGELLGAIGWYGTHAGSADLDSRAAGYANDLAAEVDANLDGSGRVGNGADNQAATQGVVGQGLLWASELDGVDHAGTAEDVLGYQVEDLWDDEAGVFASGADDSTYTVSARDAGDITGGVNAADALLDLDVPVRDRYARFFDQTFNRGRLQRAERPQSRDENAEYTLPLPPAAGGEDGQAAVYNAEVEYDAGTDEWSVTDRTFDTEGALFLANQDIWISHWGGDFFQGRGVPGQSDTPK